MLEAREGAAAEVVGALVGARGLLVGVSHGWGAGTGGERYKRELPGECPAM